MIPGQLMSDEAARLQLKLMVELANEIGLQRFNDTVEKAIESCDRRPTVATMRRLAGVAYVEPTSVAKAWELVTELVTKHVKYNEQGVAVLAPRSTMKDAKFVEVPIPPVPPEVTRTVTAMGGWGSLVDSYPMFWGQRYANFRELYHDEPAKG